MTENRHGAPTCGVLHACWLAIALAVLPAAPGVSQAIGARSPSAESRVDGVFARWSASTPGCAVGVRSGPMPLLAKGYGMADLEHDVPITAETIFEAGSVSKQFTAAAVLLLARDGKLSIDDPVSKYVPELPDYGVPLKIRHMLNHTSGLRDWGSVTGIAGWPRTTRVHTQAHVLDIVSRQRALNFTPGTHWSYSNTGFNLAAIIVARVSGMPFADFTRERIFRPLAMSHTSWRDDYTRIVQGRAIAYSDRGGYHTDMPFENAYGNGGLLTTVGDLLKWNENFTSPVVGDAKFVGLQQQPGAFNDGRTHGYAFGLYVRTYKGLREVSHSGSTAGYSAFLTRYPDERLSVAVLCNVTANATEFARAVVDVYLGDREKPSTPAPTLTAAEIEAAAGLYRSKETGLALTVGPGHDTLRGRTWQFDGHGGARATDDYGTVETYERVAPARPTAHELRAYVGAYFSEAAETEMRAVVKDGTLVLKRRPDSVIALTPLYADAFSSSVLGTIIFRRAASGNPREFSVSQDRVWDLRFSKRTR